MIDFDRKFVFFKRIVDFLEQEVLILMQCIAHLKSNSQETDESSARFRWKERSVRSKVIFIHLTRFLFLNLFMPLFIYYF